MSRRSVGSSVLGRLRGNAMNKLSLQDPLFATYVIAATLMILKQHWRRLGPSTDNQMPRSMP